MASFQSPEYRGDGQVNSHVVAFPLLIYRGKFLRMSREGVSGLLFQSDLLKLDISGNAATPVDSLGTNRRRGMPDLDATVEIGPALDIILMKDREREREMGITVTVRSAFTTDFRNLRHLGWTSNPYWYFVNEHVGLKKLRFSLSVGPVFADRRYHQYYYRVKQAFATPQRQRYDASGGYSGIRSTVSLSKRFNRFWVGLFVRFDYIGGAVYDDSPLVEKKDFPITGIAFNYVLSKSSTLVDY